MHIYSGIRKVSIFYLKLISKPWGLLSCHIEYLCLPDMVAHTLEPSPWEAYRPYLWCPCGSCETHLWGHHRGCCRRVAPHPSSLLISGEPSEGPDAGRKNRLRTVVTPPLRILSDPGGSALDFLPLHYPSSSSPHYLLSQVRTWNLLVSADNPTCLLLESVPLALVNFHLSIKPVHSVS